MTQKDFALIAGIILNMYLAWQENRTPEIWPDYVARRFAAEFATEYPNFDAVKFLTACGVAA